MSPTASLAKTPCLNCRGDKRRPVCGRCETKRLDCNPVQKKAFFRHGSTANLDASFSSSQVWVNSKPKNWRPPHHSSKPNASPSIPGSPLWSTGDTPGRTPTDVEPVFEIQASMDSLTPLRSEPRELDDTDVCNTVDERYSDSTHRAQGESPGTSQALNLSSPASLPLSFNGVRFNSITEGSAGYKTKDISNLEQIINSENQALRRVDTTEIYNITTPSSSHDFTVPAIDRIQESCLLRYFIEELSLWFDHCDEQRHFQLVVPRRAKHCPTLRNAIFAVSSRRLCRLPQYRTPHGILYREQLLPNLKKSSALEYMLKCIPDLTEFPKIQDPVHQENIMAATVILRQYEEMEEDVDEGDIDTEIHSYKRVNFLAITQTIIDSMSTSPLDCSLANACYWITVRQETYYALIRETVPHLRFDSDRWRNASIADNMIMFAGQVATWRWTQKSPEKWRQLKVQEQQLLHDSLGELEPILELKAERAKGEIFPTVWYGFDVQVTAIQHFRLAQLILTAENPQLESANRATHRRAEAQVRSIVLDICGIALCHLRIQPALVNAVIAITLYGEYFTNQEERDALVSIIGMTSDIRAWPMRKPYEILKQRWEMVDSAEI
ncbi:hypothetical protein BGW36DRAFT_437195 [Talaromyces proteolyticus]|uniref:Zn(2)-C6 fungal-type domain-containing protein n=1 Tax=Talaromyces proteolyticus TaxID=1131652 RepID=A0AAD4PTG6_9EURO|nr:uncharacterized protein BGW36DRAFT_437195 [Talaromyces proteolyticus]KAH8693255.1 hypothetical protein BGW36DRAFT_437195 [Talaromyces proteolyticus]